MKSSKRRGRWLEDHRLCPNCKCLKPKETFVYRRCADCVKKSKLAHYRRMSTEARLWRAARSRARRKGIEFDLLLEDIVIPEQCPVLGIPMDHPSLDRFDPTRGYTADNVRVISMRANMIKNDATVEDLERILAYMRS